LGSGCGAIRAQDKEIRSVADTLAEALVKHGKKDAAVVDFTDLRGNVTELGRHLAEQLSVALATNDKGIDVVDRMHLRSIMQENKLGTSGLIDPSTVRKLGQIAGVGVLVTGSLTPFGDSVELTVKALDSATARIVGASTIDIPRTKAIQDLLDRDIGSASVADAGGGQESATSPSRGGAGVERLSRESEEIVFTLNECRLSGETVRCDIEIANKGRDRVVLLGGETAETRIIDPSGHEYDVEGLRLGTSECRHCNVRSTLVQNVPMAAGIKFLPRFRRFPCWSFGTGWREAAVGRPSSSGAFRFHSQRGRRNRRRLTGRRRKHKRRKNGKNSGEPRCPTAALAALGLLPAPGTHHRENEERDDIENNAGRRPHDGIAPGFLRKHVANDATHGARQDNHQP